MCNKVWGVPVEGWSGEKILQELLRQDRSERSRPFWIVTANPEILLFARSHADYAKILQQADLRTVDGFGLKMMLRCFGDRTSRVTGVDLAERVIEQAVQFGWRVGLIGGKKGVAQKAKQVLEARYPGVSIMAEQGGSVDDAGADDDRGEEALHRLTFFDPHVLFVAFGHPKQECWIAHHINDFPNLKVMIGVGGTMDFWADTIRRAPRWMRKTGIEWLWRLIWEPRRIGRILRAVVVFPAVFLFDYLMKNGEITLDKDKGFH